MTLIGIYLSISDWYTLCTTCHKAGGEAARVAAHVLDEMGYTLDIAPQYYKPRRDTCAKCENHKKCDIITARPLCQHFKEAEEE